MWRVEATPQKKFSTKTPFREGHNALPQTHISFCDILCCCCLSLTIPNKKKQSTSIKEELNNSLYSLPIEWLTSITTAQRPTQTTVGRHSFLYHCTQYHHHHQELFTMDKLKRFFGGYKKDNQQQTAPSRPKEEKSLRPFNSLPNLRINLDDVMEQIVQEQIGRASCRERVL